MSPVTDILLVGHTHHDIGYTNSPRIVDPMHRRIVERVLDLCDAPADDDRAAMRWTFEVSRPVVEFVRRADVGELRRLRRLVDAGRVSVTGGYLNMTQLIGEHELEAGYEMLRPLRQAGIDIRTEQHGDVNGIAWGAVSAMRRTGLERLVMALNPDHGRPPFEQPTGFWWIGPDGERVFVWLSTHYGVGEQWGIIDADVHTAEQRIMAFADRLDARDDYPYDVALVHAANDNRWPTGLFRDVVRHWNERHPDRPMRTATIDGALDHIVARARGADIPAVSGEWSDWWSHGHGSTAREVSVYRSARSFALAGQAANSLALLGNHADPGAARVIGYRRGPVRLRTPGELAEDLGVVDEQLLLFAEHTWGAWESFTKPHSSFTHSHWNAKAGFAYRAYDLARDVAVEGLFRLLADRNGAAAAPPGEDDGCVVVFNPTARTRTEPVRVEVDGFSERVVVASDVPQFGLRRLPVPAAPTASRTGRSIRTGRYEVHVDPTRGGVVSLIDRRTGRQLVDRAAGHGLGTVVGEQIPSGCTHPMVDDPKDFRPEHPGPDFTQTIATAAVDPEISEADDHVAISWHTSAPMVPGAEATLRLYHDLDAVDLDVTIVKDDVFAPESIFVAFPFAVAQPRFLVETAGAVYVADSEQLPDTSRDWYSIQHVIGVDGSEGGLLWGTYDAPLVQLGAFQTGRWAANLHAPMGHLNSWVMNNLHFTNFRAAQGGSQRFRYRFAPRPDGVNAVQVRQFGRALSQPLIARQHPGGGNTDGGTGLQVVPEDRVFADLRPTGDDGDVRLRLRSARPEPVTVDVRWDGPASLEIVTADALLPRDPTPGREPAESGSIRDDSSPVVLTADGPGITVPLAGHGAADVVVRRA